MDSVKVRKLLLAPLIASVAVLLAYGFFSPVRGSATASIVLFTLVSTLFFAVKAAHLYDPHWISLVQEKSYRITWRSALATAFVTGILLLAALYAAATIIAAVTAFSGYEPLSFQIFADAVGRLRILLEVPPTRLAGVYAGIAAMMGTAFWVLYPYLPTEQEERAGPISFLAAWIFLLAAAAVFIPLPVAEPVSLALDAAIVAFWGHSFAVAYELVEAHVP